MKKSQTAFHLLFILCCIINIAAEAIHSKTVIYASKPLLMIFLSIYFYLATKERPSAFSKFILWGFVWSIAGDTFLMFVENEKGYEHFFLFGLGSFLITHVCYLIAFIKYPEANNGYVQQRRWLLLPFLLFLIGNSMFLWPDIPDDMKIPVVVYSTVIIAMTVGALNLKSLLPSNTFMILFAGVLLFVCSDSIISINKFKTPLEYARIMIMPLYLLGQYLIARGSIFANNN